MHAHTRRQCVPGRQPAVVHRDRVSASVSATHQCGSRKLDCMHWTQTLQRRKGLPLWRWRPAISTPPELAGRLNPSHSERNLAQHIPAYTCPTRLSSHTRRQPAATRSGHCWTRAEIRVKLDCSSRVFMHVGRQARRAQRAREACLNGIGHALAQPQHRVLDREGLVAAELADEVLIHATQATLARLQRKAEELVHDLPPAVDARACLLQLCTAAKSKYGRHRKVIVQLPEADRKKNTSASCHAAGAAGAYAHA